MEGGSKRTISKKDLEEASTSSAPPKHRKQEEAPEDSDIKVGGGNSSGEVPSHCGVDLVQLGAVAMDAEECRELHEAIRKGDVKLVSRLIENHAAGQYFLHEGTSALYRAFSEEKYDIAYLLISKGAEIYDSELDNLKIDLTPVNHLLKHYLKKSDKSCVDKLMFVSWSRPGLEGLHREEVRNMYETLFKSEIIKLLMMVLQTIDFDVFYDFESEKVNRLHRQEVRGMEIYGLTLTDEKEIFIGAKNLMSKDPKKRAKVYGVVAEELCHLALTNMYENAGKPYREEQTELSEEFWNIIEAVKSLAGRSCHLESSIKTIFKDYPEGQWECELIARVPHVIGIYGEETGRGILMESSELSKLLSFYEKNVVPKCKVYTDPRLNTKSHRKMEELMEKNSLNTSEERRIKPMNEEFPLFSEYLEAFPSFTEHPEWKREGIFVLTTNSTKLCTLQVFHELKQVYEDLLMKKVLFLSRNCIEKEIRKIRKSLKGSFWDYFIIVMDKKELELWKFHRDYLNQFLITGMKIIMITSTQSIDRKFNFERAVNYKWKDLTFEYKAKLKSIHYLFKGQEKYVTVEKEDFPKYFNEDDIMQIIGEVIEVDDGKDLYSQGYVPETYIEREFTATAVNGEFFDNIPRDTSVFLSGEKDFEEGLINEDQVQGLYKSDAIMQEDKSVYITRGNDLTTFMDLVRKNPRKSTIWLHHWKKVFYLKNTNLNSNEFERHTKEVSFSEKEILDFLKTERILIISDNAGCGKSTIVSNLISTVRENRSDSWIWRIDFNKFSNSANDPLSLAHLNSNSTDEEVIHHLCLMLRLNGGFEKYLFKKFSCSEEILENEEKRCFIFFDGYDEIPSEYMNSALKILSTLKEKTAVNLIITTRKHHQEELKKKLDTYSHRLVPLSEEYQKDFMSKMWKNKLKDPKGKGPERTKNDVTEKIQNIINDSKKGETGLEYQELIHKLEEIDREKSLSSISSDIDNLDFTKFAEFVLKKSSLDKETLEFIGIPLHLYMIGIINFNNNFKVETTCDIHSLYTEFLDQKILIYIEEKHNLTKEGEVKEEMKENKRKEAFRIHTKLSIQLIDEGKVCLASDLNDRDKVFCIGLGVVYENGGEIRFLHQTFAEFFIAESLRKNVRKEDIIELSILYFSGDKYKVIRRFLSSSLEKNSFENVSKECFDISFLFDLMYEAKLVNMRYHSEGFHSAKIIKSLLLNFEKNVEVSVVNELLEEIESRIESMKHVGVFLTVRMMKYLMNRNFERNSILFLHFVRFEESANKVMDVLRECIPSGSDGGPGSSLESISKEREEDIDKEDKRLVLLLSTRDYKRNGFLNYAMRNERVEIVADILKFFRDRFGEEQFSNILIDSDLILTLGKCIEYADKYEKVNQFENVISYFQECFHSEQLKQCLLSCDSDGDFLIHKLYHWMPLTQMEKYLNVIEKVLKDKNTMKQFLTIKNKKLNNALHLAAYNQYKCIDEIIQCFGKYLEKEELKETILCENEDDRNVIHMLFRYNSPEILKDSLESVKGIVGDNGLKELLKSKNSDSKNIFHFVACKDKNLKGFIQYCDNILGKEETKKLLLGKDKLDHNVIHLLFNFNSPEILMDNLNNVKENIGDDSFKELLKSKNSDNKNIFHFAALRYHKTDFTFLPYYLCAKEIADLFLERTVTGQTCLHIQAQKYRKNLLDLIDYAHQLLKCDSRFEEFLLAQDEDGNTFLHTVSEKERYNYGVERLSLLRKCIASNDVYNKILRVRNNEGKTFLQINADDIEVIIEYFKGILEKDLLEELLKENEKEIRQEEH